MRPLILMFLLAGLGLAQAPPPATDEPAARWILRQGGRVRLAGNPRVYSQLAELPGTPFRVEAVDLIGTSFPPDDLKQITGLTEVRELLLPGPIFNPGAGSTLDANAEFKFLAPLTKLEKLHFSLHFLTNINVQDKGLSILSGLRNLRELRAAQTNIKGPALAAFVNLEKLDLNYTAFADAGVEQLKGLSRLNTLYLRDTLVTDQGMKVLGALTQLEYLDLSGARLTDAGVAALAPLKKLKSLNLLGAQVTDESAVVLAGFTALEELNLYRAPLSNAGLKKLEALKRLRSLDVRYTRVTRAGVDSLQKAVPVCKTEFMDSSAASAAAAALRQSKPASPQPTAVAEWVKSLGGAAHFRDGQLDRVDLSRTPVTDEQVAYLTTATDLRLDSTEVSDAALARLPATLRRLNLSHTAISAKGLARLPAALEHLEMANTTVDDQTPWPPGLRSLSVPYTAVGTLAQIQKLPHLAVLDLTSTDIDNDALAALAGMKTLRDLRLSYGRYTDKGIAALAALTDLERLEMVRTRLTDAGLKSLAPLTKLKVLRLDYNNISNAGVAVLPVSLEELSLDTANVTDDVVPVLAALKNLKLLNLYHTTLTEAAVQQLQRALPACRIVYDRDSAIPTRRKS